MDVLNIVGGVIAILVFLGVVVVYLRGSKDKGTIDTLKRNNDALDHRVEILEAEIQRATQSAQLANERAAALESENEVLRQIPGAADAVHSLETALAEHHGEAMGRFDQMHEDLVGLLQVFTLATKKQEP